MTENKNYLRPVRLLKVMDQWVRYFNADMLSQNRNVLIYLDNAVCHPKIELFNMEMLMLPQNTISVTPNQWTKELFTRSSFCCNHCYTRWIIALQHNSSINQ